MICKKTLASALAALTLAGTLASTAGCHYPGGPRYSADRYTFESTTWQPATVTLIDTRTGEAIWTVDVPVGQQAVVGFSEGTGPNDLRPDEIVWGLMPLGRRFGTRENRLPCPPASARRVELSYRPAPESPSEMTPESPFGDPRDLNRLGDRVVEPAEPADGI